MSRFILLSLLAFPIFSMSQAQEKIRDYFIGKVLSIRSEHLDAEREIMVYLPSSYHYGYNDYIRYPVVYLLDGERFFHSFTGAVAHLSSDVSAQIPEMIVVGITSQDRFRDSSPTRSLIGVSGKEEKAYENSGGANVFLKFIETELVPFIDSKYRTNPYRTFAGYSFTGLPVLHSLFTKPEIFNSYLVIDFSAWWDDEVTLKNARTFFQEYRGAHRDVFISTVDRVINDILPEVDGTWNFIQEFEQNHPENLNFGYKKYSYKEENHNTMALISFMDGLKYVFRGHMNHHDELYSNPKSIKQKYRRLSDRLGYKVFPREDLVNYLGYFFLFIHTEPDIDKALFYFKYNTENYPLSAFAWDGLAEAYKTKGDKEKAIECFKRALELKPKNKSSILERLKELEE
nr:alpha/beta hydrolase-fold protein [uncultured Allomuricauda sp.]